MTLRRAGRIALQGFLLFAFWFVLSGRREPMYLIMGALSAGLVTFLTLDLLYQGENPRRRGRAGWSFLFVSGARFLSYNLWLLWNIIKSNVQVATLVLHPQMPIRPGLLRFRTRLRSPLGQVVLANSITLTPGTITVELKEGTYLVHALVPEAARSLLEARMQNRLEAIFGEPEEPQPEIRWVGEDEDVP